MPKSVATAVRRDDVNGCDRDPADLEVFLETRPPPGALERLLGRAQDDVRAPWLPTALLDRDHRDELRHPPLKGSAPRLDERDEGDCDEESREGAHGDHAGGAAPEEIREGAPEHLARAVRPGGLEYAAVPMPSSPRTLTET